jgi:hypothetical protein
MTGTLKVVRVTQDDADPSGRAFILHFNRALTSAERETLVSHLSQRISPAEVTGHDTVVIRKAHASFFLEPGTRQKLKEVVAAAEAQAVQNVAFEQKLEGDAATRAEQTRRHLEEIDWDA